MGSGAGGGGSGALRWSPGCWGVSLRPREFTRNSRVVGAKESDRSTDFENTLSLNAASRGSCRALRWGYYEAGMARGVVAVDCTRVQGSRLRLLGVDYGQYMLV